MTSIRLLAVLVLISAPAMAADAPTAGYKLDSINIGYMSMGEFNSRVMSDEFGDYVNRLKAACVQYFAQDRVAKGFTIVTVVDGKHSHFWFVGDDGSPLRALAPLKERLLHVPLPIMGKLPVGFAMESQIADGRRRGAAANHAPVIPDEWKEAIKKSNLPGPIQFDDLAKLVCPK